MSAFVLFDPQGTPDPMAIAQDVQVQGCNVIFTEWYVGAGRDGFTRQVTGHLQTDLVEFLQYTGMEPVLTLVAGPDALLAVARRDIGGVRRAEITQADVVTMAAQFARLIGQLPVEEATFPQHLLMYHGMPDPQRLRDVAAAVQGYAKDWCQMTG